MKHPFHYIKTLALLIFLFAGDKSHAQQVFQGIWTTQANEFNLRTGQRYSFNFPPGGTVSDRVWGTGIYTTDCSIASAAVHAGLISTEQGGEVMIEILAGRSSYEGSIQNGISSFNWGSFGSSFVFVNTSRIHHTSANCMLYSNWAAQATELAENIGQRFTYYFPPGGPLTGQVWGTGIYTTDCSIASAAVHAGLISTQNGGMVTIEILPGQISYKGTVHNGIRSFDWGSFGSSFKFVNERKRG